MPTRKFLREIESIIFDAGFEIDSSTVKNNHIKYKVHNNKGKAVLIAPSSPSDYRSIKNFKATCKKLSRECQNLQ